MNLRFPFAAAVLVASAALVTAPAFAIEQIHIPDTSAAQSSAPPDALFDSSVPTIWQQKAQENQSNGLGNLHFSVNSGNGYTSSSSSYGENANAPGSEFSTSQPSFGYTYGSPYVVPR
jgi:hypothetical protein